MRPTTLQLRQTATVILPPPLNYPDPNLKPYKPVTLSKSNASDGQIPEEQVSGRRARRARAVVTAAAVSVCEA